MSSDLLAGRYEMLERLAGGGMGQVWRGRDKVLERIVAIKTVDLGSQESTARERFRREAVATAGLSAPNVVQVYDAGVDGDTAYLVMELLTGPSVSQLVHDRGRLSIDQGLHITQEVVKGLLAAHHIGVVHRDIKPGNVMYHGDQVKLVDFGIAQLARTMGAQLTAPATAMGTAAYMSPEQASGQGATEKSDWYALGCLMMTMFTGKPPFAGEAVAVATQQITAEPPKLSNRRREVPPALDQLVDRMLAKDPAARPTGEQILAQLRLLQVDPNAGTIAMPTTAPTPTAATAVLPSDGDATAAGGTAAFARTPSDPSGGVVPAPAPGPVAEAKKRSAWPVVVGILLVLLIGAGAAFAVFNLRQGPVAPVTTPSPTATSTTTQAPTTTRRTTTRPPTTMPTTTAPPTTSAPPTTAPPTTPAAPTTQPNSGATTDGGGTGTNNGGTGNDGNSGENPGSGTQ